MSTRGSNKEREASSVLVTGGSGFVGRHLVRRLLADGRSVHTLDLVAPDELPGEVAVVGDVRDRDALDTAISGAGEVFHLASIVGVETCLRNPIETIDVAVNGTRSALEACERTGARMVLVSSSEVVGNNPSLPWSEEADRVLGPTSADRWGYASAKAVAEHLAFAWSRERALNVAIARPFNVYGPGQGREFVVPRVVRALLDDTVVPVSGTGSATRAFTYVDDVVDALVRLGRYDGGARVFHLGATRETSINELISIVSDLVGRPEVGRVAVRSENAHHEIPRRVPDPADALDVLGWQAMTGLEEGLQATIDWMRRDVDDLDVMVATGPRS